MAQTSQTNWAGWGFSSALVFHDNLSGADLLRSEADVSIDEEGTIFIERFNNVKPSLSLAAYQTFAINPHVALGPFINIVPGNNLFDAAGAGIVVELRQSPQQKLSMTVGVGVLVELETLQLAKGYEDGKKSPTDDLRFRRREEASLQVWIGAGF